MYPLIPPSPTSQLVRFSVRTRERYTAICRSEVLLETFPLTKDTHSTIAVALLATLALKIVHSCLGLVHTLVNCKAIPEPLAISTKSRASSQLRTGLPHILYAAMVSRNSHSYPKSRSVQIKSTCSFWLGRNLARIQLLGALALLATESRYLLRA